MSTTIRPGQTVHVPEKISETAKREITKQADPVATPQISATDVTTFESGGSSKVAGGSSSALPSSEATNIADADLLATANNVDLGKPTSTKPAGAFDLGGLAKALDQGVADKHRDALKKLITDGDVTKLKAADPVLAPAVNLMIAARLGTTTLATNLKPHVAGSKLDQDNDAIDKGMQEAREQAQKAMEDAEAALRKQLSPGAAQVLSDLIAALTGKNKKGKHS